MNKARLSRLNKRLDNMTFPLRIPVINAGYEPDDFVVSKGGLHLVNPK